MGLTAYSSNSIKGVIFDLDGTLVDSALDFDAMRRDLGFSPGVPILETIATIADPQIRSQLEAIVDQHETQGALAAVPYPGVHQLLQWLRLNSYRTAIFTRNSRRITELTLARTGITMDLIVAREDAPAKPDPAGLNLICQQWDATVAEVIFVGDYLYDLEAGHRAGIKTILFTPSPPDFRHSHPFVIEQLLDLQLHLRP